MVTLTNVGTNYDAITASQGLGVGLFDFTGVTSVKFLVRVQKVGNGTQSWQLWATDADGVSNGVEVGVITDAGPPGVKTLSATFSGASIPTGEKALRVRAKSSTAGDDPIFMGASVLVK